jgi:hypothetical protein
MAAPVLHTSDFVTGETAGLHLGQVAWSTLQIQNKTIQLFPFVSNTVKKYSF